ncbi:hypothetical protein STEG23_011899 [Scotinomys teguina]
MWYIYTMEYYAAEKNNDIMKFAGKWMELENVILSKHQLKYQIQAENLTTSSYKLKKFDYLLVWALEYLLYPMISYEVVKPEQESFKVSPVDSPMSPLRQKQLIEVEIGKEDSRRRTKPLTTLTMEERNMDRAVLCRADQRGAKVSGFCYTIDAEPSLELLDILLLTFVLKILQTDPFHQNIDAGDVGVGQVTALILDLVICSPLSSPPG